MPNPQAQRYPPRKNTQVHTTSIQTPPREMNDTRRMHHIRDAKTSITKGKGMGGRAESTASNT